MNTFHYMVPKTFKYSLKGELRFERFERFISLSKNIKHQVLVQNYHGG